MTVHTHMSTGDHDKPSGVPPSALEQLFAHTSECVLVFDADDRLADISAAACDYFGTSAGAMHGRTLQELMPNEDVWTSVARARDTQRMQTARISFDDGHAVDLRALTCSEGTLLLFQPKSREIEELSSVLSQSERIAQVQRETARLLGRTLELQQIFGALHEIVAEAMQCDGLIVSSYDPESRLIQCQYAWVGGLCLDPDTLPPVSLGPEGSGMQSQVIRTGKPMLFSDVGERVREASGTFVDVAPDGTARKIDDEDPVTKAAVMAPMKIEGQVTGVVQVMADRTGAYSERDVQVLESIVTQLAVAVQNAKLYERVTAELQERLRVEEALRASETRFREMANLMPVLIWAREATGEIFRNQSYFTFTGIDPQQKAAWDEVVHPDDLETAKASFNEATGRGMPWEQELRLRRADGQYRWHLSREIPIKAPDGTPLRWIGTSTDIHDSKEAERDLQILLDALPQIAWICAPDGQITYLNGYWTKLTGLDNRDLSSVPSGIHPEDTERARAMWSQALETSRPWSMEYRIRSREGDYRWHVMHCAPILDGDLLVRWVGGSADIHEQKAAGEELAKLVKERTSELEGFTYSVSHDLRTPLRAIVGSARMLQEDYGDQVPEGARALLNRQAAAANKLATLIDDLLRLSRVGRHQLVLEPLDLSAMATEIVDELRQRDWPKPLEFDIQREMRSTGDGRLVRLALENLLENACKFSPLGGRIWVGEESGSFFVRDQGIGFDMAYAHKLFQPFERLVRDDEVPGTGIGLANVRRAIERHGGRVWATSQPGHGATFYFTLG